MYFIKLFIKVILLWILLLNSNRGALASQSIVLKILNNKTDTASYKFILHAYYKDRYYLKDSIVVKATNEIRFNVSEQGRRMYMISSSGYIKDIELIVSSDEEDIRLSGTKEELNNGNYNFFGSKENYCWQAMLSALKEFEEQSKIPLTAKFKLEKFDPFMVRKYDSLDEVFNQTILSYNKELNRISEQFPNTFCGTVLAPNARLSSRYANEKLKAAFDNDNSFLHRHYFDYINLNHPEVLNSPHFRKSMDAYLKNYTPQNNTGQKHFIDLLFSKPMAEEVKRFVSGFYLQMYAGRNNGELVQYIISKSDEVCSGDTAPLLMKSLMSLQPGSVAPEIVMKDVTGKNQVLSEVCKNKKLTVLVFYSPNCSHCIDLLDQLSKLYKEKGNQLNVYAISDNKHESLITFIEKNNHTWISIAADASNSATKNAYTDYAVIGTPTLTLIDNNMKVISRFPDLKLIKEMLQ